MANIHRLGDYNNNNNQNANYRPQFGGGNQRVDNAFANQPLLGGGLSNQQFVNPRQESFFDMLKFTFCPTFTIISFIFFITMIDVLIYIATLITTGVKGEQLSSTNFLGPSFDVLDIFGMKWPYKIKCHAQLWRFVTPVFLHAGFMHIFVRLKLILKRNQSNMLSQMIIGFMLESVMGPLKVASLYIVAGIGGNVFSSLCAYDDTAVGASTAIFGLLAAMVKHNIYSIIVQLSLVFVNWKALDRSPEIRCCLICVVIFIVLFSLLMAFSVLNLSFLTIIQSADNTVDVFGHLGGFISGFFFASIVMPRFRGSEANVGRSYEKIVMYIGIVGTLIFFILHLSLFFTVTDECPTFGW